MIKEQGKKNISYRRRQTTLGFSELKLGGGKQEVSPSPTKRTK